MEDRSARKVKDKIKRSVTEARLHFSDDLNSAVFQEKWVIITRQSKPVAAIISIKDLEILEDLLKDIPVEKETNSHEKIRLLERKITFADTQDQQEQRTVRVTTFDVPMPPCKTKKEYEEFLQVLNSFRNK